MEFKKKRLDLVTDWQFINIDAPENIKSWNFSYIACKLRTTSQYTCKGLKDAALFLSSRDLFSQGSAGSMLKDFFNTVVISGTAFEVLVSSNLLSDSSSLV